MSEKERFIDEISRQTLPILLKEMPNDKIEDVKKNYINTLSRRYDYLDGKGLLNRIPLEDSISRIIGFETKFISSMSLSEKQQMYIKDEALEQLRELSTTAYNIAINFDSNDITISELEAKERYEQMKSLLQYIQEFNMNIANQLLSEAFLDLKYAVGNSNAISFRLNDHIRFINQSTQVPVKN